MNSRTDDKHFAAVVTEDRQHIEARLVELVKERVTSADTVQEAIEYTLLGGGKRLRPLLCLWTHDAYGGETRDACLDVACAIECLHTYSLVHDDLPSMDDDDMRRGKPSCHKRYGEAIAILTGDALLTLCFEVIGDLGGRWGTGDAASVEALRVVAGAAGTGGLIAGQVLDLDSDSLERNLENVEKIHRHKTGALIAAAMESGAVLAEASPEQRAEVRDAGLLAGAAFQIIDDVLDVEMDGDTLGKTPGKDAKVGKLTYPSLLGVEASLAKAGELVEEAKTALTRAKEPSRLARLLDTIVRRSH